MENKWIILNITKRKHGVKDSGNKERLMIKQKEIEEWTEKDWRIKINRDEDNLD